MLSRPVRSTAAASLYVGSRAGRPPILKLRQVSSRVSACALRVGSGGSSQRRPVGSVNPTACACRAAVTAKKKASSLVGVMGPGLSVVFCNGQSRNRDACGGSCIQGMDAVRMKRFRVVHALQMLSMPALANIKKPARGGLLVTHRRRHRWRDAPCQPAIVCSRGCISRSIFFAASFSATLRSLAACMLSHHCADPPK